MEQDQPNSNNRIKPDNNSEHGISKKGGVKSLLIPALVIAIVLVGIGGFKLLNKSDKSDDKATSTSSQQEASVAEVESWPTNTDITWSSGGDGTWITLPYDSTPPACPDPLVLDLPTPDFAKATSIAYPGQSRVGKFEGLGGNYKAHGGIRFQDNPDNNIRVVMPFNGSVVSATKDLVEGEYQYGFRIINACGVMISFGHLHDLTPELKAIADKLPDRPAGDSRATKIEPAVPFKRGDTVATVIGFTNSKNVGFDYGVYDLRTNNEASKDEAYRAAHGGQPAETAFHGLCWLDNLNEADKAAAKRLPGTDQVAGKQSDYCK